MVMPVFLLSFGILGSVFVSTLWSAGQAAVETGPRRAAHLAIVVLMILILALLGLNGPEIAIRVLAALMIASTLWMFVAAGARHWPAGAVQCAFGLLVVSGLPFQFA